MDDLLLGELSTDVKWLHVSHDFSNQLPMILENYALVSMVQDLCKFRF